MKKGIFAVLLIAFVYCILNLLVVHETLIQIEHKEPLHVIAQNALHINTEKSEHGYLTDIILPSKIFYNHAHIEIKTDTPQNAVIKFAGPKVKNKDTYKKYIIGYKNIHVNNEEILSKVKTVSFLTPFNYSIDNLSDVTIDFEYKTDFVLRNMSLVHFICSIILLLLILIFIIRQNKIVLVRNAVRFYNVLASENFLILAINGYKKISKEYKICFWVNFLVLNIVYLYLTMNFLHGNHDWKYLHDDLLVNHTWAGRYSVTLINYLTLQKYLPVVNTCLAFVFLALTPIFLVKYWKLPVTKFNIFAVSVPLLLHPALLNVLYFLFLSYAYLAVPLLLVIGLILSEKKNYTLSILSVCILLFAYGIYNVCINTLAVIFLGKILIEYANGGYNNFIHLVKKYSRTVCVILISGAIYLLIFLYLKYLGIIVDNYNTGLLPINQIFPRIETVFCDSFKHFFATYPFIDLTYLTWLSFLFIPMLILIAVETIKKRSMAYLLGISFIFILLIFSSKIVYCLSDQYVLFVDYIYWFSLPFIYAVVISYILNSRSHLSNNLLFILLIPICYLSILRDFEHQKYWHNGLEGEKILINRVIDQIETQNEFSYDKKYKLVFIGYYNSFNSSLSPKTNYSNHIMGVQFFPSWGITSMGYFMPRTKFKGSSMLTLDKSIADIQTALTGVPKEKLMKLKPWPHKDSVVVYGDTIIVCWQEKELEYVRNALLGDE